MRMIYRAKIVMRSFTLVEMLLVVVVVGILLVAILPRLTDLQTRTRDTARKGHIHDLNNAVQIYIVDHDSLPIAVYVDSFLSYIKTLPMDPTPGNGVDHTCTVGATRYLYQTGIHNDYVLIASMENLTAANDGDCEVRVAGFTSAIDVPGQRLYKQYGN